LSDGNGVDFWNIENFNSIDAGFMYDLKNSINAGQYYVYKVYPSDENHFTITKWFSLNETDFVYRETYSRFNVEFNLQLPIVE